LICLGSERCLGFVSLNRAFTNIGNLPDKVNPFLKKNLFFFESRKIEASQTLS
jgi:hypothetical protein